ncbi:MAG TPA: OmpA family protein [Cyclobacteriaceae bacterium]|nr:OmpA family protein [Cyclobacteriaceae bacterium]
MIKVFFCLLLSVATFSSLAQSSPLAKKLPRGSYLVVGAFSPDHEDYATRLTSSLKKNGRHAAYGFEETRKYWYVYLDEFTTRDACVEEWDKLRKAGTFPDVWVYTIKDLDETVASSSTVQAVQKELVTEPKAEAPAEVKKTDPITTEVIENPKAAPVYEPQTLKNTPVFLSLFNATNNEVVDGDVDVVNTETGKLITKVKGNNYITLPNPGTKSGNLTLINNTFGFRKEQLDINYKETERDTLRPYVTLVGNFYMINFGLIKIRKGDISTLYNVYFFNDAAIMLPDSKYQLNSLLQLMKDNPTMKIILHGHTNGNGRGKIIYMGQSQNFFVVTKDVVSGTGSAKELSEARAETIKMFLVDQGIDDARIAVKGWGGSRMIHDKSSSYARKNIRVDVEVAED